MGFLVPSRGHLLLCEQCPESLMAHIVVAALLAPSNLPWIGNMQVIQVLN